MTVLLPVLADSVIFYASGAEVYRSVSLKGGEALRLMGLPSNLRDLRVWATSGYVISYSLTDTVLPSDRRRYDSLRLLLRRIEGRISAVNARYGRLKYEKDLLLSYVSKEGKDPASRLLALSRVIERNSILMDSLKRVSDSLKALETRVQKAIGEMETDQSVLTVKLRGFKGGRLFLSYRISTSWEPVYIFKVYPEKGKLSVETFARITNYSSLPLLTRRAVVTTAPPPAKYTPTHRRWVLREREPVVRALEMGAPPPPSPSMSEPKRVGAPPPPVERTYTYISTRYEYRGRLNIPELGKGTGQIPLLSKRYGASFFTAAYPELSAKGYLNAVFTPDDDLAPGEAHVYLGSELTATLRYDGGRRDVVDTLFAGYDPLITGEVKLVSQRRKDRKRGKESFTVEKRTEEIRVKNGRRTKMTVVVYARRPFAAGSVNLLRVRFKPKPKEDLGDGLMMWEVSIDSGGEFVIKREIEVEYPKGVELNW